MKVKNLIVVSCILVLVSGCGNTQTPTNTELSTPTSASVSNASTSTAVSTNDETITETDEDYNQSYYQNLIDSDIKEKEETEKKRQEDLELATILLQECTKKLNNCTVNIQAETKYKCNDVDKSLANLKEVPTNGKIKASTVLAFTEAGSALACVETKELFRDTTEVFGGVVTMYAQATAQDDWSDNMDFLLVLSTPGQQPFVLKESLIKGQVYQYISKDVRSSLGRFLSLNLDSLEERDDVYVIKGTTKATFVMVDEISGNSIINEETIALNNKINGGLIDTTGILVKHNNDVTLYIDKETETLVKIEASSTNTLNEETTILTGTIEDIGTTVIDTNIDMSNIDGMAITDMPLINKATVNSR
jgi:hypothetical protein